MQHLSERFNITVMRLHHGTRSIYQRNQQETTGGLSPSRLKTIIRRRKIQCKLFSISFPPLYSLSPSVPPLCPPCLSTSPSFPPHLAPQHHSHTPRHRPHHLPVRSHLVEASNLQCEPRPTLVSNQLLAKGWLEERLVDMQGARGDGSAVDAVDEGLAVDVHG